jgi:DNA-binding MarR family transcriptional regulator
MEVSVNSAEPHGEEVGSAPIVLGLLESIERDGERSQRRIATELGVALGLVNAYLKRCVKKGLIKVREAPAKRYAYYLTSTGFAEKSRLTLQYLSYSFTFFREARAECARVCQAARARNLTRLALAGKSDLAEITAICALEAGLRIVAVVDTEAAGSTFLGAPVVGSFDGLAHEFDAVIVTDLANAAQISELAIARFGIDRVLTPDVAGIHRRARKGTQSHDRQAGGVVATVSNNSRSSSSANADDPVNR